MAEPSALLSSRRATRTPGFAASLMSSFSAPIRRQSENVAAVRLRVRAQCSQLLA